MRRLLPIGITVATLMLCGVAHAGQIWTDGNGDGLPDGGPPIAADPSTNLTVGVWFDAQAFAFTNFLAYIEWGGPCFSYVSATYVITGGSNFPIDNFSAPNAIGFGGSGFANRTGVVQVGNAVFHLNTPISCCISPVIDIYNPYYVFSQLGAGSAYMLFTTNPGTCYGVCACTPGACCFPDGSCQMLIADDCLANGGQYMGDGVSCAQANCAPPQTEACCFPPPDCSCVEAPLGQCPPGTAPQGAGTTCDPIPCSCPPLFEACCFPDASCVEAPLGQCPAGSVPQGPGTSCATTECGDGGGLLACCFADGTCADLFLSECIAAGGVPQPSASCATIVCPPSAVESRSWGHIKGLYR